MEQDKKVLRIVTNHKDILVSSIEMFNEIYKTDFVLADYALDEVNYALVEYARTNRNQIFEFGYQFGAYINQLRNDGKIID
jgi:hypothetical protein